ncbi:MAG: SDR family NAD(P)-dependent oxidoreductase, partial [Pseudomonadota bacterium]|nr:SDR family NAD(P)-dependent oxidoreductase [Pseudomonadota bacterium]
MSSVFSLEGRRAMVTGTNTGIGQGIALSLAEAGAELIAVGRSSMAETEAAIHAVGGKVNSIKADLGKTKTVTAVLDAAWDAHGPIDILVN